jgi:hypothetical protein
MMTEGDISVISVDTLQMTQVCEHRHSHLQYTNVQGEQDTSERFFLNWFFTCFIVEKALSHRYELRNIDVIFSPRVLRFGNWSRNTKIGYYTRDTGVQTRAGAEIAKLISFPSPFPPSSASLCLLVVRVRGHGNSYSRVQSRRVSVAVMLILIYCSLTTI